MLEINKVKGTWKKHSFYDWDLVLREKEGLWIYGEEADVLLHLLLQEGNVKEGSIVLDGERFSKQKERIAWICGEGSFYPYARIAEYIELLSDVYTDFAKEWCLRMLEDANIQTGRKLSKLSEEEKMYVETVCAIAQTPRLLIVIRPYPMEVMSKQMEKALSFLPEECGLLLFGEAEAKEWLPRITGRCFAAQDALSIAPYQGEKEMLMERGQAEKKKEIEEAFGETYDHLRKSDAYASSLEQEYDAFHLNGMEGGEDDEAWRPQNDRKN